MVIRSVLWTLGALAMVSPGLTAEEAAPRVGSSYFIAGNWFQYLGKSDESRALWLYPHVDGVFEVFVGQDGARESWEGLLGSRYDPSSGEFSDRFNAAELLNEYLDRDRSNERRQEAVRPLPPEGSEFVALGTSRDGTLVLEDISGHWFEWDPGRRELLSLEARPDGSILTPSLLGAGGAARLGTPEGCFEIPVRSGHDPPPGRRGLLPSAP